MKTHLLLQTLDGATSCECGGVDQYVDVYRLGLHTGYISQLTNGFSNQKKIKPGQITEEEIADTAFSKVLRIQGRLRRILSLGGYLKDRWSCFGWYLPLVSGHQQGNDGT